jgi:tetratricopeptide (TPR) repeat protein
MREADRKRPQEDHVGGQQAIDILTNGRSLESLSSKELNQLAIAYNWVGDHRRQINVSDIVLSRDPANAEALDSKANGLENAYFLEREREEELRFYDECIRARRAPLHLWYLRKARALCGSAVDFVTPTGDGDWRSVGVVGDRSRYEEAFQCLQKAFEIKPDLLQGKHDDILTDWLIPQHFPVLSEEQPFKDLTESKAGK